MTADRLNEILSDWAKWMKKPSHKLGYSSCSNFVFSGGVVSSDAFAVMIDDSDYQNAITINAIIEDLPNEQFMAINARWLDAIKPKDYQTNLSMAYDNLMVIADKRGIV